MFYFENRENETIVNEMFYFRDGISCKRGRINSRENFENVSFFFL